MVLKLLRVGVVVAVVLTCAMGVLGARQAIAIGPGVVSGDLFQNYYVPPDPYWGVGAQMYISPRPTPPWVGNTFVTYEPLMPHEFLYQHHRTYYRQNPGAGMTKVTVHWHNGLFPAAPKEDKGKYHDIPRLPFTGK
jgi:hypothetical protein